MKKFIIHFIVYGFTMIFIIGIIFLGDCFFVGNQYEQGYQASLVDKVNRLESIDEPKIILVGNSNLSFGVRSYLIEKELGMPVVNLGLHGGLGNRFHENIAKLNINKNDIVVICHSSYNDNDRITDTGLATITLEWHRELWEILENKDYIDIARAVPSYVLNAYVLELRGKGNQSSGDCYSRDAFNKYGDNVYANGKTERYTFTEEIKVSRISETCVKRINALNQYVKQRGATLLIAGYPIADGEFTEDHELFVQFEKELREKMECPVISSVNDYFFEYDYFYNTVLHLTEDGAIKRTEQLIQDLKNYLAEHP